jgi:hypothetical protein
MRSLDSRWKYDFGTREYEVDKPFDPSSWHLELSSEWGFVHILWAPLAMKMPAKAPVPRGWARDYGWLRLGWSRQWMSNSGRTYAGDYYRCRVFFGLPVVIIMAYPTFVLARWLRRGRLRWERGECLACGYNLTGNVTGTCPECGGRVHGGSDLPYVMRVRRRLLAGCAVASVTVLAVALVSMVYPVTLWKHGSVEWKGSLFEPEELVYVGDPAPVMQCRFVSGRLTFERRRATYVMISGVDQSGSVSDEWRNYGSANRYAQQEEREVTLWQDPKDCSLAGVARYHSFAKLIRDRYRCVNVLDLSLWPAVGLLGLWPVLELVRFMRKRRAL